MSSIIGTLTGSEQQWSGASKTDIQSTITDLERQRDKYQKQQEQQTSDELERRLGNIEERIKNLKSRLNKAEEDGECQTCANRKYQDGSDDPGVSFKSASKISGNVESAVRSHEQEHVTRNRAKAERENREIVYQSVIIKRAICPECGDSYVAGGETTTVTRSKPESKSQTEGVNGTESTNDVKGAKGAEGTDSAKNKDGAKFPGLGESEVLNKAEPNSPKNAVENDDPAQRELSHHDSRFDVGLYDKQVEYGQFLNLIA